METPEINRKRAAFVLGRIDEILSWDRAKEQEKDARFVELENTCARYEPSNIGVWKN